MCTEMRGRPLDGVVVTNVGVDDHLLFLFLIHSPYHVDINFSSSSIMLLPF